MKEADKKTYELIAEEIDTGNTHKASWTKAFSDAEGDDKRTRALYIKYRFEEISNEEQKYHEDELDDDEDFNQSKSEHFCYNCSKPEAKMEIRIGGELRLFCNDECFQSCLSRRSLSFKNFSEQQEYSKNRTKKIKEYSPMMQLILEKNKQSDAGTPKTKKKSMYGLFHETDSNAIDNSVLFAKEHTKKKGSIKIGGFLYLFGLLLVINLLFHGLIVQDFFTSSIADLQTHNAVVLRFTNPQLWLLYSFKSDSFSAYYDGFRFILYGELCFILLITFLFFSKNTYFVRVYISGSIIDLVCLSIYYFSLQKLLIYKLTFSQFFLNNAWMTSRAIVIVIFAIYFLNSQRVKQTFVN